MPATLHFEELNTLAQRFSTGVSLHSHTCFSKETLGFVYRYARDCGILDWAIRRGERQYEKCKRHQLDFGKAYWTPPVAPAEAVDLEAAHIRAYGLDPLVSITDHDTIEAPSSLIDKAGFQQVPLSVEWTVPFRGTFFHLGIHNIPGSRAGEMMNALASFTANPDERVLHNLLPAISENPGTLTVFNHPCWDEKAIGKETHRSAAREFVANFGDWFHAVELNGLRPWSENREVIEFSREIDKPLISGGDRHALNANTVLNFTTASSFSEFTQEIRAGYSEVVITPAYWCNFRLRLLDDLQGILSQVAGHGLGWQRWDQRVFFECKDGEVRSLSTIFGGDTPAPVQIFVKSVLALKNPVWHSILNRFWAESNTIDLPLRQKQLQTFHSTAAERVS